MRVIIKVGRSCNNFCTFCHASDRRRGDDARATIEAKIRRAAQCGARMVILSGGEPTLHPDLSAFADLVANEGMDLGLVTNGRRLADSRLVKTLTARRLRYAYVSLHGGSAVIHDAIVRARAFAQTSQAIRNLHGQVDELTVNAVVTRDNLHHLRSLVDLLRPFPALCIKFTFPQPKGAAHDAFDLVVPLLSDAARAVSDAIAHGSKGQPPDPSRFGLEGFPACTIPGLEHLRNDLYTHHIDVISEPEDDDLIAVDTALSMKTARCEGCRLVENCPGIYRVYVNRRGDGELEPLLVDDSIAPAQKATDLTQREQAAHERRQWVRLTYACNNRCLFCLDRDTQRSDARRDNVIKREIIEGRRQGAERLILSGGEPTTHPRFAHFVRLGKRAGYRWVQTITNGRMLSYPRFLATVMAAGLDEVTISMHGHRAELHDRLVGVKGAFDQASAAVRAAVASRRLVVNIDIVINAFNVDHLPEMLETFVDWGVREFDLLQLIPFGAAWESEHHDLFYDLEQHIAPIRRALAFAQREGIHLWLNRFPPPHAEGFEFLIQDPHKLHDEVRGRQEAFETFVHGGPHLPCRAPDRCARCYLKDFCDAIEVARKRAKASRVEMMRVHATRRSLATLPAAFLTEVVAPDVQEAVTMVTKLETDGLRLRLDDMHGLAERLGTEGSLENTAVREVVVTRAEQLSIALACPPCIEMVVDLNQSTAPLVASLEPYADRLILCAPTYERLSEAVERDVDLLAFFEALPFVARTRGMVPCLSGRPPEPTAMMLDASTLRDDGVLDPQAFTLQYVRELFFTRSLRCSTCVWAAQCRGMHVNWIRAQGFAKLDPKRCKR